MESHLLQMRGLKPHKQSILSCLHVASFTDAWIETILKVKHRKKQMSHLLQMRGLKLARA